MFFDGIFRQIISASFDNIFWPRFSTKFLSKKAVWKWCRILLTKIADEKNCRIIIRQQFFSTTFFDKILRHSTKFLRFFSEICRKTLSMTVFFDNIFWQHFSPTFFDGNFRQQFFSTIFFALPGFYVEKNCRILIRQSFSTTFFALNIKCCKNLSKNDEKRCRFDSFFRYYSTKKLVSKNEVKICLSKNNVRSWCRKLVLKNVYKNFSESLDFYRVIQYNISIIRYIKGNKKNSKKYLTIDIRYSTI